MMIPAGKPVDATIEKLQPLLERGDVLIDGGNSWFEDTGGARRRCAPRAFTSWAAASPVEKRARGSVRR